MTLWRCPIIIFPQGYAIQSERDTMASPILDPGQEVDVSRKEETRQRSFRRGLLVEGPGKYLVLMMFWIWPFLILALCRYPVSEYFLSYVSFIVPLISILAVGLLVNLAACRGHFWLKGRLWRKYLILVGSYTAAMFISVFVLVVLHDQGVVESFGADPEGNIAMVFIPTAILYWIVGACLSAVLSVAQALRKRRK